MERRNKLLVHRGLKGTSNKAISIDLFDLFENRLEMETKRILDYHNCLLDMSWATRTFVLRSLNLGLVINTGKVPAVGRTIFLSPRVALALTRVFCDTLVRYVVTSPPRTNFIVLHSCLLNLN